LAVGAISWHALLICPTHSPDARSSAKSSEWRRRWEWPDGSDGGIKSSTCVVAHTQGYLL